jgi:thimet oligopeptidase
MARLRFLIAALIILPARVLAQGPELQFDRLKPEDLEPYVKRILDSASKSLQSLLAKRGPRTVENTLRPFDDYRTVVNRGRVVSLLADVHPDSAVRAAASRAETRLAAHNEARRMDRRVYEMLRAVDTSRADAEVRYWLRDLLDAFRRDMVDRDSSVRVRAAAIQRELARLGQAWGENPRNDTVTVAFDSVELGGMSAPWFAAHRRDAQGRILVAGQEMRAILNQVTAPATRRRALEISLRLRSNHFVLDTMLQHRYALARLLGFRSWADYQLRGSMAGSPEAARSFLDDVRRISEPALRRSVESRLNDAATKSDALFLYDLFVGDDGAGTGLGPLGGVGAAIRPYLQYSRVRDGIFDLVRELLDLEFRPAPDLPVWHPTVEPFRVYENGKLVAMVYLDLHWRPGKSQVGASASSFRSGVRDRVVLEAALIGGMVRPLPGEPALLGPRPMETLFHEFGHLLHYIFAVRPWWATSGLPNDFDFREVPSNLFAAWAQDPDVVSRFARHYQTGQPAPRELLERLRLPPVAGGFMAQFLSRMSLEMHDRPPGDLHAAVRQAFRETVPSSLSSQIRFPEGDLHAELMVPHFGNGYDAAYYTYLWSSAIARDLLTKFDRGLLDRETVQAYKKHILEPGRSRPAKEMVEAFLGRPFSLDAYARTFASPP